MTRKHRPVSVCRVRQTENGPVRVMVCAVCREELVKGTKVSLSARGRIPHSKIGFVHREPVA